MDEKVKSWLVRGGAVGAGVLLLAVLLPLVYYAFLSALGLAGLAVMGLVGVAGFRLLPYLGQRLENAALGLRRAEARANPIEQIQGNVIRKAEQLKAFKDGMTLIGGQIGGLETSLNEQAKRDPEDDLSDQRAALAKMREFYDRKRDTYTAACKALEDYKKAVERAKFKYGFGTAAQGIANAMNDNDAKALMESMLADEAFQSVDQRYNAAFAALDLDSAELSSTKQLSFGRGAVIDVEAIKIPLPKARR